MDKKQQGKAEEPKGKDSRLISHSGLTGDGSATGLKGARKRMNVLEVDGITY